MILLEVLDELDDFEDDKGLDDDLVEWMLICEIYFQIFLAEVVKQDKKNQECRDEKI